MTEHQSRVNYRMAFRMLQYIVLILDAYEKEINANGDVSGMKEFMYPLILLIVFYDGKRSSGYGERSCGSPRPSASKPSVKKPRFKSVYGFLNRRLRSRGSSSDGGRRELWGA
jgi:hypothetical protein